MKALGIIPARFASTRFPGKPLALISGKSLIQRVYENAKKCPLLQDVIVATDDAGIYKHVEEFGGHAVMTSTTCPSGTDRLSEVIKSHPEYQSFDVIVNVQGDEPCLEPQIISKLIEAMEENSHAHVATPITQLQLQDAHNTSIVKCVINLKGRALYFSRALIPGHLKGEINPQVTYYKHVGIYAYRLPFLLKYSDLRPTPLQLAEDLEQLKILEHGYEIQTIQIDGMSIEVNVPEDIQKVELYLCTQNSFS